VIVSQRRDELLYLLLRRISSHGGFWQSVTGSLEEGETHRMAAQREVLEETGIRIGEDELIELGVVNTFEIAAQWRKKYEPGVTSNEEVCFALRVHQLEIQVDPLEHDAYTWEPYERANKMLHWESNKRAFAAAHLLG
jgi:dihydroneopterin triphosphate diphosphatase